ncbi:ParB/Srx family N-terminal domain-containing protein [Liquorilactobacillus cacaonum]|uniref:Gram-positive cocci surface proteins LPxTG domain-containing protein n=1 Tax=Liquorilactobacillus cacaonum DSM 21116 TaxID=1423729 RepID=A0A0R2CF79_9LACO|nr:ParB/Srx family N-terminal domain-containing protein [Liquorilactobacillus cacaonum]KRM89973.1 hypothetical protein FC80_GL001795 [Liquorilactobacillus cacaonum DSM 21116]
MNKKLLQKMLIPFSLSFIFFLALNVTSIKADNNILYGVPISSIHPTQAAVGKAQIAYNIQDYIGSTSSPQLTVDYFNDFNEDNGYTKNSVPSDGTAYNTKDILGSYPDITVTAPKVPVIIGPNNIMYATDGHHGMTTYEFLKTQYGLGSDKINVRVIANYSNLSQSDFYQKLIDTKQAFPYAFNVKTGTYQEFSLDKLPTQMSSSDFVNDPFRSLAYFWRKSAIDKDTVTADFAEFYLGEFMVATGDFKSLTFQNAADYQQAFKIGNEILEKLIAGDSHYVQLFKTTITDKYGITAAQLGIMQNFDSSKITKQQAKLTSALGFLFGTPSLEQSNTNLFNLDTTLFKSEVSKFNSLNSSLYTADSYAAVKNLITQGQAIIDNSGSQNDLDSLTSQIQTKLKNLVLKTIPLDTTKFDTQFNAFQKLIAKDYTTNSYTQLQNLITQAKTIIAQNKSQSDLDSITTKITIAFSQLETVPKFSEPTSSSLKESSSQPTSSGDTKNSTLPQTGEENSNDFYYIVVFMFISALLVGIPMVKKPS